MDDSDLFILNSPLPSACEETSLKKTATVDGVPTSFSGDNMKRFSFGVSSVGKGARRSLSQPLTSVMQPSGDEEEDFDALLSTQAAALISPKKRVKKIPSVADEFFGVYCLISRSANKSYKNRCYIGYTVDPNRRITQHNGGKEKGGAKKTDSRGPWDMVCIIHGFPNSVAALRFEWAWQNPDKSKAIKNLQLRKNKKETPFAFRLRIACHLMNSLPWCRFALTFRWLMVSEELPFPTEVLPPKQVGSAFGLVTKTSTPIPQDSDQFREKGQCYLCKKGISCLSQLVRCLAPSCNSHYHTKCLAAEGLQSEHGAQLFPIHTTCPSCSRTFLWGDVIRDQRMMMKVDESRQDTGPRGMVPLKSCSN